MNLSVIVVVAIIAIATMIGFTLECDRRARAWRRIAEERRWNWEARPIDGQFREDGSTVAKDVHAQHVDLTTKINAYHDPDRPSLHRGNLLAAGSFLARRR